MKKLVLALVSNSLMIVLPLLGKPVLMVNYKILILVAANVCIWLTQPAFTVKETNDKKESDKFSVILILSMSYISIVIPIIHWAYFMQNHSAFTWFTAAGILMMITGIVFRAWAVNTLGAFFTPTVQIQNNHQLVTKGPYSIVRHPSYTGAFLSIVGGALVLDSLLGLIAGCLAMTVAYYFRIKIEEDELTTHFGKSYSEYKQRTKKIIPFVW
jgi:protein-S-isoprenylcysteine O-methyltransferase Ste14